MKLERPDLRAGSGVMLRKSDAGVLRRTKHCKVGTKAQD